MRRPGWTPLAAWPFAWALGGCFVDLPSVSEGATGATTSGADSTASGAATSAASTTVATTGGSTTTGVDPGTSTTDAATTAATTGATDAASTTGCAPTPWYPDLDEDGHGDPAGEVVACEAPRGMIAVGGDCRDDDPLIFPGAFEVCDTIDNDCDAYVDEFSATNLACKGCTMEAIAGRVYHRCPTPRTRDAARTDCLERYADLVVLELFAEHDALAAIEVPGGTRWWIGLGDAALEGSFQWVDGTPLAPAQANWGAGQPDNYQGVEDCVELTASGTWNDITCAKSSAYVCEGPIVGS